MTMPAMDPALHIGYETGRRMLRRHDPTYYIATRRLPRELRPATHALYGFVRTADQIVDGPRRPPTPAARRAALDAWEAELLAGARSSQPVVRALADAASRHRLPLGELATYMRSMRIDCAPVRISSWEELVAYMEGSAGSVGRIMASLLGVPARHQADFGRLGLAFQLANFIRDVREDHRLDRVYLPASDRACFGVAEADLGERRAGPPLRALIAHEVARTRELFAAAAPAVAAAPRSVRPGVRFAISLYGQMLDRVEAAGFDVLGRAGGVRVWHVPGAALEALRR
jgi:15-cis-phytoene synthase